ncbi:ATP-binding protein [Metabacillus sp. GX 13764]|uniref:two-component system sensor histidine kinase NtrB n=1 Tax=Metabacillus kandeliae TaxID=2900151 RepID=UPI001E5AFFFD|nr:ATP-binding protein [Metabacillus kandeliae]MCD7033856.1 ATP-binding protein [Metabacillus kandeliae]
MKDYSAEKELKALRQENLALRKLLANAGRNMAFSASDEMFLAGNKQELNSQIVSEREFTLAEPVITAITNLSPNHMVMINDQGIITLINEQTAKDFQVDRQEMIGKHIRELLQIPDEQIMLLKSLQTGKPITKKEVLDKNYGITSTHLFRNKEGKIFRVLGYFQYLNSFRDAEKQALSGRIAAGIAHEIRNPLTTVRGFLQILQDQVKEGQKEVIKGLLIPEIDRANKIISDFLAVAKPAETATERMTAEHFVTGYLGSFMNGEALLYNTELSFDIEEETRNCRIDINKEELLQVFLNLMRNAIQAKAERPLQIRLLAGREGDAVRFVFSDNGSGIPPHLLQHIFDPFFTTKDDGTGLGLSLSKKIIENHGGSIQAESSKNGTVFTIKIPAGEEK